MLPRQVHVSSNMYTRKGQATYIKWDDIRDNRGKNKGERACMVANPLRILSTLCPLLQPLSDPPQPVCVNVYACVCVWGGVGGGYNGDFENCNLLSIER